jgi:L,D-peptidoglycan transpeptidase YkuD (ErfK/YbiS/YcfS/YnhG family)
MPRPVVPLMVAVLSAFVTVAASLLDHHGGGTVLERITPEAARTLPDRMVATGGGTQLITAVTAGTKNSSRDGTLTWWERRGEHWVKVGSTAARFGVNGLSGNRLEGDGTTPTGVFTLPLAFGIEDDPGTEMPWRNVTRGSWWDENSHSGRYNTWFQNCPKTVCWKSSKRRARSSEHLVDDVPQYDYAVFIGFNTGVAGFDAGSPVRPPDRPSGSGIFLHVFGTGHTAGCVSVKKSAMVALLRWLDPAASPHIAIGNAKSIYRF